MTNQKPLNEYTIHDWTGQEHAKDCPRHPDAPRQEGDNPTCANIQKRDEEGKLIDACCPDDIVVCAGNKPVIIQAEAHEDVRKDSPRIEPGDRRRGEYYVKLIGLPVGTGLQRVKTMKVERLLELEKIRQIRTGDRPPDWVLEARRRAAEGHDPTTAENANDAMTRLSIAARNW